MLRQLEDDSFFNLETRSVTVQFTAANANINMICMVRTVFGLLGLGLGLGPRPVGVDAALVDERPRLAPSRVQALAADDPVEGVVRGVAARDLLVRVRVRVRIRVRVRVRVS